MTVVNSLPYRHPVVRDLAWVMASPGLLQSAPEGQALVTDEWCQQTYTEHEQYLISLDENPRSLMNYLANRKSHRLGIYFEWLLRYWLEEILHVTQLGHNVPVFQLQETGGKRTLGEFDFLFRVNQKQTLQQWEATVKFYLQKIDAQGKPYWVGPGDLDRLDIKLNRLFQHQLKLAELPEAEAYLSGHGVDSIHSAGFVKGYLFYPLSKEGAFIPHPAGDITLSPCKLSTTHNKGWWYQWGDRPIPSTSDNARWLVLPKNRWLSPVFQMQDEGLLTERSLASYCESYFRGESRPLLLVEMHWQEDAWREVTRGFVLAPEKVFQEVAEPADSL